MNTILDLKNLVKTKYNSFVKCRNLNILSNEKMLFALRKLKADSPEHYNDTLEYINGLNRNYGITPSFNVSDDENIFHIIYEDVIKYKQNSIDNINVVIAKIFVSLHEKSLKDNKDFTLTYGVVKRLLVKRICHYTNTKIQDIGDVEFDLLDQSKGYVPSNLVVCTKKIKEVKEYLVTNVLDDKLTLDMLVRMASVIKHIN